MTVRFYSSVASEKTLTGTITSGQTTMVVSNVIGLPGLFPYTLAVDYETATEELVEVTNAAGTTLTITRAIDGTSASSHNAGARVRHVTSARDFSDSRTHENSSSNVHGLGVGEDIVGTTSTQTLTNKTLTNAQGSMLNPDFNLNGSTTTSFTRSPVGGDTVNMVDFVNGTEQTLAMQNNGHIRIRNTLAMDTAVTTRRWSVVMSDGVTERAHMATSGMLTTNPRSGTSDVNGGFKVVDPGDSITRKAIQVRDSGDANDRFVVRGSGAVDITPSSPTQNALEIRAAAGQSVPFMRVTNNASDVMFEVDTAGDINANRRGNIKNAVAPSSTVLSVFGHASQTEDLQRWNASGGTPMARVRADGTSDFTGQVSTSGIFTAAAGWSVSSQIVVTKAGIATIAITLLRTGAPITPDSIGNILGDPPLGTVAAAFRPHPSYGANFMTWACSNGIGTGSYMIRADTGDVNIFTWSTGGDIGTGSLLRMTMSYPLDFS